MTTLSSPCGVCATIDSFKALPSTEPVTGISPIWLPNVPVTLPDASFNVAVAGRSPPGVFSSTSHLPLAPIPVADVVVVVVVVEVVVVDVVVVLTVPSDRFAVQSPSPKSPNLALPAIDAPSTLPTIVISSDMPCTGMVKPNFTSPAVSDPPSNGSSPNGDFSVPDSFSPSCLKVALKVVAPCGELSVTSQSPVTFVCANAGAATPRRNARTVSRVRVILRLLKR